MSEAQVKQETPWQRVFAKFGMTQNALAIAAGWDRSKVSRALADPDGLINGKDQVVLLALGRSRGVTLLPADFLPVMK